MESRGVQLPERMPKDLYMDRLIKLCASSRRKFNGSSAIASIIECRGAERFKLIADALEDPRKNRFYKRLVDYRRLNTDTFLLSLL